MIIVFDGSCNFCNQWVRFIIRRDRKRAFQFAPVQSEKGGEILTALQLSAQSLETLVLIDGARHYDRSDAVLQTLKRLRGFRLMAQILTFIPKRLRDACYDAFAHRRHTWFGNSDVCSFSQEKLGVATVLLDDPSNYSRNGTMQLSDAELARLELMFASNQVRSDPPTLSVTDQTMDAMLHAEEIRATARIHSSDDENCQATEEIAHDSRVHGPRDILEADHETKKGAPDSDSAGESRDWNFPRTLEELIDIRRSLLRGKEQNS